MLAMYFIMSHILSNRFILSLQSIKGRLYLYLLQYLPYDSFKDP